jgi:hypothetical protein
MIDMGDDAEVADIFHNTVNLNVLLYPKGLCFRYSLFRVLQLLHTRNFSAGQNFLYTKAWSRNSLNSLVSILFRTPFAVKSILDNRSGLFNNFENNSIVLQERAHKHV